MGFLRRRIQLQHIVKEQNVSKVELKGATRRDGNRIFRGVTRRTPGISKCETFGQCYPSCGDQTIDENTLIHSIEKHRGFLKVLNDRIIVRRAGPSVVVVVVVVIVVVVLEVVITGGGATKVAVFEVVVVVVKEQLLLSPHLAPGLQAPHNSPTLHTVPGLSQHTASPA